MNRNILKLVSTALCAALGVTAYAQTQPQTIVSTFGSYNGNVFELSSGEAFGQTVHLDQTDYSLTGFSFEYIAPDNYLSGLVGVNLAFYADTGVGNTPVSVPFYNSGYFFNYGGSSLGATNTGQNLSYNTGDFTFGDGPGSTTISNGFVFPTSFTIAITFSNIDNPGTTFIGPGSSGTGYNGHVSLPLATNNNTYASTVENDYWINNNGVWSQYTNAAGNNVLFSVQGVPEPSAMGLGAVAGLLILGAKRFNRKS